MKVLPVLFAFFTVIECAKASRYDASKFALKSRGEMIENLFNIYDPSFLSYVWPKIKNGVHLSTSRYCWEDISLFFRDLAEGHAWAYKTADASGRYHSGIFAGNSFWLGSKEQCLSLDDTHVAPDANDTWGEFYSGDYINSLLRREKQYQGHDGWSLLEHEELMRRMIERDNTSPISLSFINLQISLNITKFSLAKSHDITLGVCLPRSCSPDDVLSIINFSIILNDNLKSNKTIPRTVRITSLRYVENTYDLQTDIGAVILTLVTVILVTLAIIATVVDLDIIKFKPYKKSISFDLEQYDGEKKEDRKKVRVAKDLRELEALRVSKDLRELEALRVSKDLRELEALRVSKDLRELEALRVKNPSDLKLPMPPTVTLDVTKVEGIISSCNRCGKYKKQCPNSKHIDPVVPCPRIKYNSCASLATEYKKNVGAFKSLLLSFSLKHSWMKLFNTSMANKDLSVIHGLKIISTLWIIFVHVAVVVSSISEHGYNLEVPNNIHYIVYTGTLAFDTLFFASGLFSAHHFFYLKSRYSVEELVNFGGVCGQALQLLCFITNRAIRLLPSYMYVIFLTSVLSRVSRDTAVLSLPERDFDTCKKYWWRNILYINNMYAKDEQCMQVSWYLSVETQLHMFGALLCLLLTTTKRRMAALLAFMLVLSTSVYDVTTAYSDFDQRATDSFSAYALMINRPWARVAPYFLGVLTAWILHHLEGTVSLCKTSMWCLWAGSVTALVAGGAVPWLLAGWASAWLHVLWPLALLWPAVVCATQYVDVTRRFLESNAAAGLSRACYGAFLLHGVMARGPLLAADAALCERTVCIWWYFAGTSLLTLVAAVFLCLVVEMPICSLLRRLSDYSYR